jgi:hypothetical protein
MGLALERQVELSLLGPTRKFGRFTNKNRIVQSYRCMRCVKTSSETQPLDSLRVESDKIAQAVQMRCEGMGIRATSPI